MAKASQVMTREIEQPPFVTEGKIPIVPMRSSEKTLAERVQEQKTNSTSVPTSIRVSKDRKYLTVDWGDGTPSTRFLAEFLRACSPSTDVMGANFLVYGKRNLQFTEVVPQGSYALRFQFSDGHTGGIYPYTMLKEIGQTKFTRMRQYIQQLRDKRKPREVRRRNPANTSSGTVFTPSSPSCGHKHA